MSNNTSMEKENMIALYDNTFFIKNTFLFCSS